MDKFPFFQLYPGDWIQDTRPLTLAAKGAWIDILCALWRSQTRGSLSLPIIGWARVIAASVEQTEAVIAELLNMQICDSVTDANKNVTLVSRRQIREESKRVNGRIRQKRYRQSNAPVTPDISYIISHKSEVISHKVKALPPISPKAEIVIPDDLKESEMAIKRWLDYKREKGQTYKSQGLNALWGMIRKIEPAARDQAIDQSMANNYSGIFPPKGDYNAAKIKSGATPITGKYAHLG